MPASTTSSIDFRLYVSCQCPGFDQIHKSYAANVARIILLSSIGPINPSGTSFNICWTCRTSSACFFKMNPFEYISFSRRVALNPVLQAKGEMPSIGGVQHRQSIPRLSARPETLVFRSRCSCCLLRYELHSGTRALQGPKFEVNHSRSARWNLKTSRNTMSYGLQLRSDLTPHLILRLLPLLAGNQPRQ